MSTTTFSLKTHADHALSPHFKVKEFACKDGSDKVLIADALVRVLEAIRKHFGKAVTINSGYRTEAYNAKIGGAKASQHVQGTAADIRIAGITPREVAVYAEKVLAAAGIPGGVGLYEYSGGNAGRSFCHVDVRAKRARWLRTDPKGKDISVTGFGAAPSLVKPTLRKGSRGEDVKALQKALGVAADGIFGAQTELAVRAFQTQHGLKGDGIVGALTWKALEGLL